MMTSHRLGASAEVKVEAAGEDDLAEPSRAGVSDQPVGARSASLSPWSRRASMPGGGSDDASEELSAASSHDSFEEDEEEEAAPEVLPAPSSPLARPSATDEAAAEESSTLAEESVESIEEIEDELDDGVDDEAEKGGESGQGGEGLSAAEETSKRDAPIVPVAAGKAAAFTASDGTTFSERGAYRKYEFALSYTFAGRRGGEERLQLRKAPGSIEGQPFVLEKLSRCEVQLLDHSEAVQADYLEDCRVFIAASCDSVFVRNCTGCTFTVACKQVHRTQRLSCHRILLVSPDYC